MSGREHKGFDINMPPPQEEGKRNRDPSIVAFFAWYCNSCFISIKHIMICFKPQDDYLSLVCFLYKLWLLDCDIFIKICAHMGKFFLKLCAAFPTKNCKRAKVYVDQAIYLFQKTICQKVICILLLSLCLCFPNSKIPNYVR